MLKQISCSLDIDCSLFIDIEVLTNDRIGGFFFILTFFNLECKDELYSCRIPCFSQNHLGSISVKRVICYLQGNRIAKMNKMVEVKSISLFGVILLFQGFVGGRDEQTLMMSRQEQADNSSAQGHCWEVHAQARESHQL